MGHEELERRDDCATNQKYGQRVIERSDHYTLSIPPALHLSKSERFSRVPPLVSQTLVTCRVTGHVSFHGSPTRTGPTEHETLCLVQRVRAYPGTAVLPGYQLWTKKPLRRLSLSANATRVRSHGIGLRPGDKPGVA